MYDASCRRGYDKAGRDQYGFDAAGFDRLGFDKDGFDKAGYGKLLQGHTVNQLIHQQLDTEAFQLILHSHA
jgi:hypothetical protein